MTAGREAREDVLAQTMRTEPGRVDVAVAKGVVRLSGRLQTRSGVLLLGRLAARMPGAVAVESSVEPVR